MKKIFSVILAFTICLTLTAPVFAVSENGTTSTLSPNTNVTHNNDGSVTIKGSLYDATISNVIKEAVQVLPEDGGSLTRYWVPNNAFITFTLNEVADSNEFLSDYLEKGQIPIMFEGYGMGFIDGIEYNKPLPASKWLSSAPYLDPIYENPDNQYWIIDTTFILTVVEGTEQPSSWAVEQVNAAIAANLVPTSLQSKYTQATTRAEFCALAVALYENVTGKTITERKTFDDTKDVNVEKMAAVGVVSGVGDNKFAPDDKLTREQAAVMLARLADAIGKPLTASAATFSDNAYISSWAIAEVGQIQAAGIMGGVGNNTFAPKDPYTREQSIITIMRLYDVVK